MNFHSILGQITPLPLINPPNLPQKPLNLLLTDKLTHQKGNKTRKNSIQTIPMIYNIHDDII